MLLKTFDLVLDGHGSVHVFPAGDPLLEPFSIDIATNTGHLGIGILFETNRAKLHPSGDSIYGADTILSPSDVYKFAINGGVAEKVYESRQHGNDESCGDLWFKQDGTVIYTACGNTFTSGPTLNEDLFFSGHLQVTTNQRFGYRIQSLSQSDATDEIVLLEYDPDECAIALARCYTHLNLYDSDSLSRTAVYSLAPLELDGSTYSQRGIFVFHSADGLHRYVISGLWQFSGNDQPYYLTVQQ
jgi:hypothetical protein